MTETGNVAPGWYPDGSGAFRYFDGAAWTEHVHPEVVESPHAPDPEPPAAVSPRTTILAAPGPRRRRHRVVAVAVASVAVVAACAVGAAAAMDDGQVPSARTASPPTTTAGSANNTSPVTYGAAPAIVASVAGCTDVRDAIESAADDPVEFRRVTCTLGVAPVEVNTYPDALEQTIAEDALRALIGEGSYARGDGWVAVVATDDVESAQAFAAALGGTIRTA